MRETLSTFKMAITEEVICPSEEDLLMIESDIACPLSCGRIFSNTSSLEMHLTKTHKKPTDPAKEHLYDKQKSKTGPKTVKKYFCPVEGCPRSKESKRPFPRMGQLKQVW